MPALDLTPDTPRTRMPQLEMANFCHKQLAEEVLKALEKIKGDVNAKGGGRKVTLADLSVPEPVTKKEVEDELLGGDYEMPNFFRNQLVPAATKQVDDGLLGDGYQLVDPDETLSDAGHHQPPLPPPPPPVLAETKGRLTAETLATQQTVMYNVGQWARSQSSGPGSLGAALPQESMFLLESARPPKAAKAEEHPGDDSDPPLSRRPSSPSSQGYVPVQEWKQADVDVSFASGGFDLPTTPLAPVEVSLDDIDLEPKKNTFKAGKAHK